MNIPILLIGVLCLLAVMSLGINHRLDKVEEAQEQTIQNQETIIIMLGPRYSHDIFDYDTMKTIKPKVGK